jgi:hypothetical protein
VTEGTNVAFSGSANDSQDRQPHVESPLDVVC